jgi:hypothetical protein
MKSKFLIIISVSILVLFLFTFYLLFKNYAYVHGDTGRDLLILEAMRNNQLFPLIGHENIIGYNVPVYYFILFFTSFITGIGFGNIQNLFIFWTLTGIVMLYFILYKFDLPIWFCVLITSAYAISFFVINISIEIWSINLVFMLIILFFYLLYRAVIQNNLMLVSIAFISLFLAISIDLSTAIFFPIEVFWISKIKVRKTDKFFLLSSFILFLFGFFSWWLLVNSQAFGSFQQYLHLLPQFLFKSTDKALSFTELLTNYFSNSLWINTKLNIYNITINFNIISLGLWLIIILLFVVLFFRKHTQEKTAIIFTSSFICIAIAGAIIFYIFSHKLYPHHLYSINFIQVIILALVFKNYGKIIKSMLIIFLLSLILFSSIKFIKHEYGYPSYQECLIVAQSIKNFTQNHPLALIYYDINSLQGWETTRYYYCLRQVNIQAPITILDGSFGLYHPYSYLYNMSDELPETAILLCKIDQLQLCIEKFHREYSSFQQYIDKYEIKNTNMIVMEFYK